MKVRDVQQNKVARVLTGSNGHFECKAFIYELERGENTHVFWDLDYIGDSLEITDRYAHERWSGWMKAQHALGLPFEWLQRSAQGTLQKSVSSASPLDAEAVFE